MRGIRTPVLTLSLLAFTGTAGAIDLGEICCDGGYEYRHPSAWEKEQQRLRDAQAAVGAFLRGNPGVAIRVANDNWASLVASLLRRELDLAVVGTVPRDDAGGLDLTPLSTGCGKAVVELRRDRWRKVRKSCEQRCGQPVEIDVEYSAAKLSEVSGNTEDNLSERALWPLA